MSAAQIEDVLRAVIASLRASLGENLYTCILYGSAVRGDLVPEVSDINLLVVLNESTPSAHAAIAQALPASSRIDPFVLGRRGLERSVRLFASKFASIRRNYRVLHGVDVLADVEIDPSLERFLCEQALRNLRLRFVRAFIVSGNVPVRYEAFIQRHDAALFVQLSELVRLAGIDVPKAFADRIDLLEKTLGVDSSTLKTLLHLKRAPRRLNADEVKELHAGIFSSLDRAIQWLEEKWPD